MLIIFNKSGSLLNVDFQYDSFSQGDMNVHDIDVIVLDDDFENYNFNGYVQFLRQGETEPSPKLIMTNKANIEYNEKSYNGYSFKMESDWYTAIAGTLKMTIEIKQYGDNGLTSNKAYGIVNIPVQESVSGHSQVESIITNEEYNSLLRTMANKVDAESNNVFSGTATFKNDVTLEGVRNNSYGQETIPLYVYGRDKNTRFRVNLPIKNGDVALKDDIPDLYDWAKQPEKPTYTKEEIGLGNVNDISVTQDDLNQITANKNNIEEVEEIANQAIQIATEKVSAIVFGTYNEMVSALKSAQKGDYRVGTTLYLREYGVPDYWISGHYENNNHDTGYYIINRLETEKVDLENYYTIDQVDARFVKLNSNPDLTGVKLKNSNGNNLLYAQGMSALSVDETDGKIVFGNTSNSVGIASSQKPVWKKADGTNEEILTSSDLGSISTTTDILSVNQIVKKVESGRQPNFMKFDDSNTRINIGDNDYSIHFNTKDRPWLTTQDGVSGAIATIQDIYNAVGNVNLSNYYTKTETDFEIQYLGSTLRNEVDTKLYENVQNTNIKIQDELKNYVKTTDLNNTISPISDKANEALDIAKGKSRSKSFSTYNAMISYLKNAEEGEFQIGDNLYIIDTNVSDYWVSIVYGNNSGNTGYYGISKLETDKVSLTDYYTKTEVDTKLENKVNTSDVYSKSEINQAINSKANKDDVYTKTEIDNKSSFGSSNSSFEINSNENPKWIKPDGSSSLLLTTDNKVIELEEIRVDNAVVTPWIISENNVSLLKFDGENIISIGNYNKNTEIVLDAKSKPYVNFDLNGEKKQSKVATEYDLDLYKSNIGQYDTIVPQQGYINSVYINTSLNIEEVNDYLDKNIGNIITSSYNIIRLENNDRISLSKVDNEDGKGWLIQTFISGYQNRIFDGAYGYGWQTGFNGKIELNGNIHNQLSAGIYNDLIKNLISKFPFDEQTLVDKVNKFDSKIGDINSILDTLNGEVI